MDACTALHELDYIWPTVQESIRCYEPGILSLMPFVLGKTIERMGKERQRPAATA